MGGRQFSVFDELERWAPSSTPTLSASVSAEIPELDRLIAEVEEAGYVAEDWTRNLQVLCKRCSEGPSTKSTGVPAWPRAARTWSGWLDRPTE